MFSRFSFISNTTRIVLTGGGTGGHVFPLLAVANELEQIKQTKNLNVELFYFGATTGPVSFDPAMFESRGIQVVPIRSASPSNATSPLQRLVSWFQNFLGLFQCLWHLWRVMPDVVFSKGGFGAVPVVAVSFLYRIPVIIHESDAIPGRVNLISKKFASRIAISFEKAAQFFPMEKTALVGNPTRRTFFEPGNKKKALRFFGFKQGIPVLFIYGGSQGAQALNNLILNILPDLVNEYQIIHQCGTKNYSMVFQEAEFMLKGKPNQQRYRLFGFLDEVQAKHAYTCADLVISRAGSANIFEIAAMAKPSILIPFPYSAGDHQRENAYAYARNGAAMVLEEGNLKSGILLQTIRFLLSDQARLKQMVKSAKEFSKPQAAYIVAQELLRVSGALSE